MNLKIRKHAHLIFYLLLSLAILSILLKSGYILTLDMIFGPSPKPNVYGLGGRGVGVNVQIGGVFHQANGFVKVIMSEPPIPDNCRYLAIKGGPTGNQAILTVQVNYGDGTRTELDITLTNIPQYIEHRIELLPNKHVSNITFVIRGSSGSPGYYFAQIIDSELYLCEIRDAKPEIWAASGMYVIGGPDAYAYLNLPGFQSSDLVPIFSGLNPFKPSDLRRYSAFLFYNSDPMDLVVLLTDNQTMIPLWQYANDNWSIYKNFIARQAPSQVQNTAFGQFVLSKYAVETQSNSPFRVPVQLDQSGKYHVVLRVMGLSPSSQPFNIGIEINGENVIESIPNNRFVTVDIGSWDLTKGAQSVSIWKIDEGEILGDYIAFIPENEWQRSLTNAQNLFDNFNGTVLLLYGAATYNSSTALSEELTLPYQLDENCLQIPPGGSVHYNLTIPQTGKYTPFIHSLIADTIVEVRVDNENNVIVQENLSKQTKTDAWEMWGYKAGEDIYLAKGSYQLTLTNKGPSFAIFDLYGFIKIGNENIEPESITFACSNSDHVSIEGVGQNFFIVFGQVYNDGWSGRQGDISLEHIRGFFFLNTFYVDKLDAGASIDITYSDELISNLLFVSEITFSVFVVILIIPVRIKKKFKKILQARLKFYRKLFTEPLPTLKIDDKVKNVGW